MSDPWDGPGGQATRSRTGRVPEQRADEPGGTPRPGGRAAARAAARSHGGKRSRRRARPVRRGRRVLKIVGMCLAILVLATAGAGWWFYQHLNGNINSVSLNGKGGSEKADAFGRTPINILVMGSDGRTSKADCKLGGGCSQTGVQTGNGNADVQMVVHISADRSNATVMSIPRDTMVDVPACKDSESGQSTSGYYGQINSALRYGPACQVATIHQLTGIPIDHFVKLDFSGVVKMSDAVGGVSVCVDHNVYDTYSHLKLSQGSHTLKGEAALEFVRSRHGFGDGSDLGRTVSQHIFLSAMIRKFKSAGTLTDPTAVYGLADAATKALTVDDGLGSVKKLIGLAADVNKVPTKRMTFTTMQTAADPNDTNRVVVGAGAKALFSSIADDQSLTTGSGKKSTAASATATAIGGTRLRDRRDRRERHRDHRPRLRDRERAHRPGLQLRDHHRQRAEPGDHHHPHLRRRSEGRGPDGRQGARAVRLAPRGGHRNRSDPGDRQRLDERHHVSGRFVLAGARRHEGRGLQRAGPDRRRGQEVRQGQPLQDGLPQRGPDDTGAGVRGGARQEGLRRVR